MNGKFFILGCILVVAGLLITVFDYPQLVYLESAVDPASREMAVRIQTEFGIGIGLTIAGPVMMIYSVIRE